jgi:hypothetical protein
MARFFLTAVLFIGSFSLFAQILGCPGTSIGYIDFDSCEQGDTSRSYISVGSVPLNSDIELGPDGELFVLTRAIDNVLSDYGVIAEVDHRTGLNRRIIFMDAISRANGVSLGNGFNDDLISAFGDSIFGIDRVNGGVYLKGVTIDVGLLVDVICINDTLYGTAEDWDTIPSIIAFREDELPAISRVIEFEGLMASGLGTTWSNDCSERLLISARYEVGEDDNYFTYPQLRKTNGEILQEGCPYKTSSRSRETTFGYFWGIASYDNYISVCELRIDLDQNDSGSRFGPHFWQDAQCTNSYPVADTDVSFKSMVGMIDSVTVKLRTDGSQPGFDKLRYPATDRLIIRNYGDTLLHLVATPQTVEEDYLAMLPQITLDVTAPEIVAGERIVETFVYAGGLRSDQARTFVQVALPQTVSAGQDTTVVVCPGGAVNLLNALGPGATPGGNWFPSIPLDNKWVEGLAFYDVPYEYSVGGAPGTCAGDTSFITVVRPQSIKELLPIADTTIALCPGKSFLWDINVPEIQTAVVWNDGSMDAVRVIDGPGEYSGLLGSVGSCLIEGISLSVTIDSLKLPSSSIVFFCEGDTVTLANGSLLTSDSTITTFFELEPWECDSTHLTSYRFQERERLTINDTLCTNESITIRDVIFEQPGIYEIIVAGVACDTLIEVVITGRTLDTIRIDTTLSMGEVLEIMGVTFTEAGTFTEFFPSTGLCGTVVEIDLDFSTSTAGNLIDGEDVWYPTVLRAGRDAFRFHSADESIRVSIERLQVFDGQGRLVTNVAREWQPASHLATGVYFFRAQLLIDGRAGWTTGKLVVTNGL